MATKEQRQKFALAHPGYYAKKSLEFYHKHKAEISARKRANPKVLYGTIKRNAYIRNLPLTLTKEEFCEWWKSQQQICVYCSIEVERLSVTDVGRKLSKRLSVDRKDNKLGYEKENIVLACLQCNFIKSNLFTFEEMREIGQKYIKPKWQS